MHQRLRLSRKADECKPLPRATHREAHHSAVLVVRHRVPTPLLHVRIHLPRTGPNHEVLSTSWTRVPKPHFLC